MKPLVSNPQDRYLQAIEYGEIDSDPHQANAVLALQTLYMDLCVPFPAQKRSLGEILQNPFKKPYQPDPKGVYMYGGVGRGKSMLMDMFMECIPPRISKRRVHFHEFMIEVHNFIHDRKKSEDFEGYDTALPLFACDVAREVKLLCFDEFHVTDIVDAMILAKLFSELWRRGVVVVATSNWAPDSLYEGGLQRELFLPFIALLKERMMIVPLEGSTDYRTQSVAEKGTYFWPLNGESRTEFDEVFKAISGEERLTADHFTVKGRDIQVMQAKGAARVSFGEWCGQPHGAEDYIELAKRYHSVFIEGIPQMDEAKRNEAKRFMLMIDSLYEERRRVIFTAAVPPDALYTGDTHNFEFDRTVSRITEMQAGYNQDDKPKKLNTMK